jgi:hypothetical protein
MKIKARMDKTEFEVSLSGRATFALSLSRPSESRWSHGRKIQHQKTRIGTSAADGAHRASIAT